MPVYVSCIYLFKYTRRDVPCAYTFISTYTTRCVSLCICVFKCISQRHPCMYIFIQYIRQFFLTICFSSLSSPRRVHTYKYTSVFYMFKVYTCTYVHVDILYIIICDHRHVYSACNRGFLSSFRSQRLCATFLAYRDDLKWI